MKRLWTCLLTLVTLLALTPAARADVLWEPDNNFYEKHADECTYIGRSYYANGPEGFVTLWDAPNGSMVAAQYENGFTLPVYWQYQDWGCVTVWGDEGDVSGWVPMSELYLIYDYISFEEEYGQYFTDYAGEFTDYTSDGKGIQIWAYPNNDGPKHVWDSGDRDYGDLVLGLTGPDSIISKVYTDSNGDRWGYVGYFYGRRNFWINMDNPAGDGVMSSDIPQTEELIASGQLTAPQTPVMPSASRTPYFLVGGAVVVTLGLLGWFYGRKRSKK